MPESKPTPASDPKKPKEQQEKDTTKTASVPEPKQFEEKMKTADSKAAPTPGQKKPEEKPKPTDVKAVPATEQKKPEVKFKAPDSKVVPTAEQKKPEQESKTPDAKTAPATEPKKPEDQSKPSESEAPPAAEQKKTEVKPKAPDTKAVSAVDQKKSEEKPKVPNSKVPNAEPQKQDAKGPFSVSGTEKVEIPIDAKSEQELTSAQKAGQTRKEHTQAAKDWAQGKTDISGKPLESLKSVPAGTPKEESATGPAQAAEGPKGIVITQVFDDRLAPPSEADLKNLPIPKEGEAFSMRLHPAYFFEFLEHPFTINRETKDYKDLYESIKENGIHDPVYVRPREKGGLEIMSGHRRHDIGAQLNYPIPTIIVRADDDTARIAVVDGNLHRMDIPTSELARAAKMKMEALTRKAGRRSKMEQLAVPQKRSDQQVAEDMGMSRNQVQRLVRIDSLVPELKQQVDEKKLPFNTAVELSYMKPEEQSKVVDFMAKKQVIPSMAQATELKEASKHAANLEKYTPSLASEHKVDEKKIESIIKPKKTPELKVTFTGAELKDYFPRKTPGIPEVKRVVFEALDLRKKALEKQPKKQEIKNPAR